MTDYTQVEQETPREAVANMAMILRERGAEAGAGWTFVSKNTCDEWASRLERAVRMLDQEKQFPATAMAAALADGPRVSDLPEAMRLEIAQRQLPEGYEIVKVSR